MQKIKSSLTQWKPLPLSLIGRVNVVKMNILLKCMYLFQCLPLFIPKSFFSNLDSLTLDFIWNGKVPSISKKNIYKSPKIWEA